MLNIIAQIKNRKNPPRENPPGSGYYYKLLALWFFLVFAVFYLLKSPTAGAESVRNALTVCAGSLVPSLFPFAVLVNMINSSGLPSSFARLMGKPLAFIFRIGADAAYALILGILGGFPIGAVCVGDLYEKGIIDEREALRLTSAVTVASPAFCIGAVGGMFAGDIGVRLYLCQLAASMTVLFITRGTPSKQKAKYSNRPISAVKIFTDSISAGGITMIKICSFVIFFAVVGDGVCAVTKRFFGEAVSAAAASLIEITLTLRKASSLPRIPSLLLSAFAVGYSGLSVHMQVFSVLRDCKISKFGYLLRRTLQGVLSAVFMYISLLLF